MKKIIGIFLITIMVLSIGLLTYGVSAAPEAAPAPAQSEQAPAQPEQDLITLWDTKINLDGSASTTILVYIPKEQLEQPNFIESVSKQIEQSGYTAKIAEKDGKKMLELKKEVKKGQPIAFSLPELSMNFDFLTVKDLFSTMYVVTTSVDMRRAPASQEIMKLTCNLPIAPKFTNAEGKAGLVNTWTIKGGSANPISLVLIVPNFVNISLLLLILAVLILIIALIIRRRRILSNLVVSEFNQDAVESNNEEVESNNVVENEEISEEETEEIQVEEAVEDLKEVDKKDQE